jgi:hypothetical protein
VDDAFHRQRSFVREDLSGQVEKEVKVEEKIEWKSSADSLLESCSRVQILCCSFSCQKHQICSENQSA